jgi:hypothetical protein
MNYIDFGIAVSLFLIFFGLVLIFTTNYFSNLSSLTKTSEFRAVSEGVFNIFFERKGTPENWEKNYSVFPVQLGLAGDLYIIPVLIKENGGLDRTNEPITVEIIFDETCQNKSWNNTIRVYDENYNQMNLEISNATYCISQFLNQSNITWNVNISANQNKNYFLYYSPDDSITAPSYVPLSYNTSSWIPTDRDEWTNTTTNWSRLGGASGTVTNDTTYKKIGNSSVNITGTFDTNTLGLRYNPYNNITGASNGWYVDAWLYIDDKSSLKNVTFRMNDNNVSILANITDYVSSGIWHHFEKRIDSTYGWLNWTSFNASRIDYIDFYLENNSKDLTRAIKIDGLHLKKKPLEVKTFPETLTNAFSSVKFNALKNMNYDEIRKTLGENYQFKIEVGGDSYGEPVNKSANAVCYDYPKIIQSTNGSINKAVTRLCIWK